MEIFFLVFCGVGLFWENLQQKNSVGQVAFQILFFYAQTVRKQVGELNLAFLSVVLVLYTWMSVVNVCGMVTYSSTATAQLGVTFFLAAAFTTYINTASLMAHGWAFFGLFFPTGSPLALAFLITPIEIVSYFFRKISLSVRLFANMMAGHTLLKVIVGFVQVYFLFFNLNVLLNSSLAFTVISPLLIALVALEVGVALIQGYVFTSLITMYSVDGKNLH